MKRWKTSVPATIKEPERHFSFRSVPPTVDVLANQVKWGDFMICWPTLALAVLLSSADHPPLTACQLEAMSRCELEELYRRSPPASGLHCFHSGKAFKKKGCGISRGSSLLWKGKVFEGCVMINRWCLGLEGVRAQVSEGCSWLDGNPSLILDYRGSSKLIWRNARDEVREVGPGLYLGIMYVEKGCQPELVRFFILEADCCGH
jgi:hypothetical protein